MVDTNNLEECASIGVTATILVLVTLFAMRNLYIYKKNHRYPQAQAYLIVIILMPVIIGWLSWAQLFKKKELRSVGFLLNIYKAACLTCFVFFIEKMLGRIMIGDENHFSEKRIYEVLCTKSYSKWLCIKCDPITTIEEAKKYLWKKKVLVLQFSIVLSIAGIVGGLMILSTGNYTLTNSNQNVIYSIFGIIVGVSSLIALLALLNLGLFVNDIPEMKSLNIFHKFFIIKAAILVTEIQSLIIELFAYEGLIANTSVFSLQEITTYTNSLLVSCEMTIISFLIVMIYPLTDYDIPTGKLGNPEEEKLIVENKE